MTVVPVHPTMLSEQSSYGELMEMMKQPNILEVALAHRHLFMHNIVSGWYPQIGEWMIDTFLPALLPVMGHDDITMLRYHMNISYIHEFFMDKVRPLYADCYNFRPTSGFEIWRAMSIMTPLEVFAQPNMREQYHTFMLTGKCCDHFKGPLYHEEFTSYPELFVDIFKKVADVDTNMLPILRDCRAVAILASHHDIITLRLVNNAIRSRVTELLDEGDRLRKKISAEGDFYDCIEATCDRC